MRGKMSSIVTLTHVVHYGTVAWRSAAGRSFIAFICAAHKRSYTDIITARATDAPGFFDAFFSASGAGNGWQTCCGEAGRRRREEEKNLKRRAEGWLFG